MQFPDMAISRFPRRLCHPGLVASCRITDEKDPRSRQVRRGDRAAARSAVYEGGLLHGPIADHVYAGQVAVFWTGGVRSGLAGLAGTVVRSRQGFPLAPAGS